MPIPKTETAKSTMVRRAIARSPSKFPKHSKAAGARKVLAEKIMRKRGKSKEAAYAIATAAIKGTTRRGK